MSTVDAALVKVKTGTELLIRWMVDSHRDPYGQGFAASTQILASHVCRMLVGLLSIRLAVVEVER